MTWFGSDDLKYEVVEGWGRLPQGWRFGHVIGVAVDRRDRVHVFHRGEHPVVVFDAEGGLLGHWGEGVFATPHGIHIQGENVYCTDSADHTVRKFTLGGGLLRTWGTPGVSGHYGKPFYRPTDVALAPNGDMYVSDGYGNSRVHRYNEAGDHVQTWGEFGRGAGEFDIPHDVWVHRDGRVMVADRENNRIQFFSPDGEYLDQWAGLLRPCSVYVDGDDMVYVAELRSRVSVLDMDGEVVARWGGEPSGKPGLFIAPHCAWTDSCGDLYVGETLQGSRIQKFRRH